MPGPKKKVVKDPQAEIKARIAREAQESIDRQKSKVDSENTTMQKTLASVKNTYNAKLPSPSQVKKGLEHAEFIKKVEQDQYANRGRERTPQQKQNEIYLAQHKKQTQDFYKSEYDKKIAKEKSESMIYHPYDNAIAPALEKLVGEKALKKTEQIAGNPALQTALFALLSKGKGKGKTMDKPKFVIGADKSITPKIPSPAVNATESYKGINPLKPWQIASPSRHAYYDKSTLLRKAKYATVLGVTATLGLAGIATGQQVVKNAIGYSNSPSSANRKEALKKVGEEYGNNNNSNIDLGMDSTQLADLDEYEKSLSKRK